MTEHIVSINGMTSSTGWWLTSDHSEFEPVAVWLMVDTFDDTYPTLGVSKKIVGLKSEELLQPQEFDLQDRWYYHDTQFEVVGRELK